MKKFIQISLIAAMLMTLTGCALFRNPLAGWAKATTKVESVQQKQDANQDALVEKGKNYVYGTKLVLDADPSTNVYHSLATEFNDKAIATLGTPTMDQITMLQTMVKNLLSTNTQLIIKGEKQLASMDAKVADLQEVNKELDQQLNKANQKLEAVGTANAGLAQKWANVVRWVWYFIYGAIFVAIIKVLAVVLPPPYNSIVGLIAVPFGLVSKLIHSLIPEAKAVAGVVSENYKTATEDLVSTIQKLKDAHPELHKEISATVLASTDSNTSAVAINDAKTSVGLVS